LLAREREIISNELFQDKSVRYIAKKLDRHHSCIAREIANNGGASNYSAINAQTRAEKLRTRPKARKLETCRRLHDVSIQGGSGAPLGWWRGETRRSRCLKL
jgi:IS30 family transposase